MFELKTKLNFSSSNPNNFCIVPSNTTTDKCTLVRETFVNFYNKGLLPTRFPLSQP